MTIPQFKVYMDESVNDFVLPVLHSGFITQGQKVEDFELALKSYLGFEYGLTVNSGTSALMLALHLAGAKPGTNVVSTPMTCSATNEAIALTGADIIWADVDAYGNINPNDVFKKINGRTVAVMAVDWGGLPCDYDALRWATESVENGHSIPIIEDAAHAFGAEYKGQDVAISGGDYVCYSFQAIKHLTSGDGGLVVCPDEPTYERGKLLRWFGLDRTSASAMRSRQDIREVGYKFHMNDINASIGLANIGHMDGILYKHRENADYYDQYLSHLRPDWPMYRKSSYWLYTIHVNNPIGFEAWAAKSGVTVSQVHMRNDQYSCFSKYKSRSMPGLDEFSKKMVCIPVGWWLTQGDMDWVIEVVNQWVKMNP